MVRLPDELNTYNQAALATCFFAMAGVFSKSKTTGAAMKIDENVPTPIPIKSANENPRSTSPPNINNIITTIKVVPDVNRVLLNVLLIASLNTVARS